MAELPQAVRGFSTTFFTMFRKVNTEQYPEEKAKFPPKPAFHGRHQLNRHPDGLEKCVGCELCAWACPADAIYVEGADNVEGDRHSPGERYGAVYQINYLRCILCGLCIEACPTRALTMTNEYELADNSREKLIYEKEDLLGPLLPGMVDAPHSMVAGMTAKDYYDGKVTGATPEQAAEVAARQAAQAAVVAEAAARTAEDIAANEEAAIKVAKARGVKDDQAFAAAHAADDADEPKGGAA